MTGPRKGHREKPSGGDGRAPSRDAPDGPAGKQGCRPGGADQGHQRGSEDRGQAEEDTFSRTTSRILSGISSARGQFSCAASGAAVTFLPDLANSS